VTVRVLWVSRHPILIKQLERLKDIFDEVEVENYEKVVPSAEFLVKNVIVPNKFNIVIPLLPLTVVKRLVELGNKHGFEVWWVEMETVKIVYEKPVILKDYDPSHMIFTEIYDEDGKKAYKIMRFKDFKRVKEVRVILEDINNF